MTTEKDIESNKLDSLRNIITPISIENLSIENNDTRTRSRSLPLSSNERNLDTLLLSPPKTERKLNKKDKELELKLEDARKKFNKNRRMESQLGLVSETVSIIGTPNNEVTDIEEQIQDRREELGFRRNTFWKSCCGQVIDRRATQFFVQVIIGAGVMVFCMAKIWYAKPVQNCTGEDTTVYFSLLSALIGFYIPSPSMSKNQ